MKSKIEVRIPDNFTCERKYAIKILLRIILDIDYDLVIDNSKDYIIHVGPKKLIVNDHFFNLYDKPPDYLKTESIPDEIPKITNDFTPDRELPVIFGNSDLYITEDSIICGQDIFASAFFMLTRWEEYAIQEKDEFGRFPDHMHLSVKNNFYQRPVVNEYAEYLRNILVYLGFEDQKASGRYTIYITHDVDRIYGNSASDYMHNLLRGRDLKKSLIGLYYKTFRVNPAETFHSLMDISESMNVQSHFYFISGGSTAYEGYYTLHSPLVNEILIEIKKRNHIIGFHPSYCTCVDNELWSAEKRTLEVTAGVSVYEGRQHYLRFSVPHTWQIWDDNNMNFDSTMGFSQLVGFRCGTGNEFPVFNVLTGTELRLREKPLIIMDSALKKIKEIDKIHSAVSILKSSAERYNTPLTIIFHNHIMDNTIWNKLTDAYKLILNIKQ